MAERSQTLRYPKQYATVNGRKLAYVEHGSGDPIVFLHGNPTSSYLWRNVMPHVEGKGRLIAPDLIGQGDSEKIPASEGADRYGFKVAYQYLEGLLEDIKAVKNVTFVLHDWGSGLGFHWARNHPDAVKAIVYMEAVVMPIEWSDFPSDAAGIFKGFRSVKGEDLILNRNMFIEGVLPSAILRKLSDVEMNEYRRPFAQSEDRQVLLNWPRHIPIDGEPPFMVKLVDEYGQFLKSSNIPKLFINAEPGSLLVGRAREFCRSWANQQEVTVKGSHFIQEDSPDDIGRAIADWVGQNQ